MIATKPQAYHNVNHIITTPLMTVEDYNAHLMTVRLTHENFEQYNTLLVRTVDGEFAGYWQGVGDDIHLFSTGEGMLVMMDPRIYHPNKMDVLRSWNHIENIRIVQSEGWVWIEKTEYLDPNAVIDAIGK